MTVEWGYPPSYGIAEDDHRKRWGRAGPYAYSLSVVLYTEAEPSDEERALLHLHNLGYPDDCTLAENLLRFQRDHHVWPADGTLTDAVQKALATADDEGLSREELIAKASSQDGG